MPITLKSTGGGSVSIDVPSTGSTFTLTAPANNATIFTTDGGAITGNVAFTSNNVSIGGQTASPFGAKNKIINGAMVIDQRNAGASVTASGAYTIDRWYAASTAASKYTVQRNAGSITPPVGFSNYLGITSSSAYTAGAAETFNINQGIEGLNVFDLAWGTSSAKTVTLSFWVYSSLTGTFSGCIGNGSINRSYPFTYTISSSNTWSSISVTIPGDTTGTWATDNSQAIGLYFDLGSGSNFKGTAGSWSGSNYKGATGGTSVVGTSGATFYITGVQLEAGSVATPFEFRQYGTELALCQRYYVDFKDVYSGVQMSTANILTYRFPLTLPVEMRSSPTVTYYNVTAGYNAGNLGGSGNTKRINTEITGSSSDFRPGVSIKAEIEL